MPDIDTSPQMIEAECEFLENLIGLDREVRSTDVVGAIERLRKLRADLTAAEGAIALAKPYVAAAAEPQMGYGFFCGGDPREFHPDDDATDEERANHKTACEAAERGEMRDADGKWVAPGIHVTRCQFGLGSYTMRDEEAEKVLAALSALSPADRTRLNHTNQENPR